MLLICFEIIPVFCLAIKAEPVPVSHTPSTSVQFYLSKAKYGLKLTTYKHIIYIFEGAKSYHPVG